MSNEIRLTTLAAYIEYNAAFTEPSPAPAAPSSLSATAVSGFRIDLSWTDNSSDEDGFKIERSADGSTGWTQIGTAAANATSYSNSALTENTTYYYRVRAYNGAGDSDYSNTANATTPLAAPTSLTATTYSETRIDLAWVDNSNAETAYWIERSPNGSSWSTLGSTAANETTFSNTGLTPNTTYYYRIKAVQGGTSSAYSNTASATTSSGLRATGLAAYVELDIDADVRVTGLAAYIEIVTQPPTAAPVLYVNAYSPYGIMASLTYGGTGQLGFEWQYSLDSGSTWLALVTTGPTETSYRHFPLTPATTYCYRVRAIAFQNSDWSNVACATTLVEHLLADGVGLWIDVYDANNNKLGPGPLIEIMGWRNIRRLSRAGEFSVEFPATYTRLHEMQADDAPLLTNERYLYCFGLVNEVITLIGAGIVKEIELNRRPGQPPVIAVSGPDLLGELRRVPVRTSVRPWQYTIQDSTAAPVDIVGNFALTPETPADWTISGGNPTSTAITAKFIHSSILAALGDIGAKLGEHFRGGNANNGRQIEWLGPRSTFANSNVRAELSVDPVAAETNTNICLITDIQEIKDSWDLLTRIFVFGAGAGQDRLDLAGVTHWPDGTRLRWTITSISGNGSVVTVVLAEPHNFVVGVGPDNYLKVSDTQYHNGEYEVASIVDDYTVTYASATTTAETSGILYGSGARYIGDEFWSIVIDESRIENVIARQTYGYQYTAVQFKEIAPLSNSDADIAEAANQLFKAAYNWLRTRDNPAYFYRLSVAKLDKALLPGQLIRTVAKGYVEGVNYLNIDRDLIVMETTTEIDAAGVRTTGLVVATTDRWPASDAEQAASEFHQAEVYGVHHQMGPAVDTISYIEYIDDDHGATLYFWLGEETTIVNQVVIRMRTDKLRSTVKSVGGTVEGTVEIAIDIPAHSHDIPNHDHYIQVDPGGGSPADIQLLGGAGQAKFVAAALGSSVQVHTDASSGATSSDSGGSYTSTDSVTLDLSNAISAVYGVYEDPGTNYSLANLDLEFAVNGGAWQVAYTAISGASGWYEWNITDEIAGPALRPRQKVNSVAVRVRESHQTGLKCQLVAQIERRTVIQSIATL